MVVRENSRGEGSSTLRLTATLHPRAEPHALYNLSKRSLDIVLASLLLIASDPVVLLAALLIFIESPGNPFYVQRRVAHTARGALDARGALGPTPLFGRDCTLVATCRARILLDL